MNNKISFSPCLHWIRRGVAKQIPNKIELTKEDLKRIISKHKQHIPSDQQNSEQMTDLSEEEMESNDNNDENSDNIIEKYDLDNYEDDSEGELGSNTLSSLAALTVFGDNADDPYLEMDDNEDETEENEDFCIKPTDCLVLVGRVESDVSVLEVRVYSESDDHYVHHDLILPAFPVCLEWIGFSADSEEAVNHIGIGDMTKDINIWDVDTVNSLEPVSKLVGHEDAVLDLSWNSILRKVIASASADQSCCVWDLEKSRVLSRWDHFKSNVQTLEFHPFEAQTLLIGDSNGIVSIADCQSGAFKKWTVGKCEVERVIWNKYNPYSFFCSTSDGKVVNYDVRNQKAIYSIQAHSDSVTGLALSTQCTGCLITASTDKVVKVWDVDDKRAEFITEFSDLNVGAILGLGANPDLPFIIAIGGDNRKAENFKVIDISKSKRVSSHFVSRISKTNDKNDKKKS